MQGVFVTTVIRRSAVAAVAACAVLTAGGTAAFAGSGTHAAAPSAAHQTVVGGKTSIQLNSKTVNALVHDKFSLAPTGNAKVTSTFALVFHITGGTYTNPSAGTIKHSGGIKISKGSKSVTIKNLVLKLKAGEGTAAVSGKGRIAALKVGPAQNGSQNSFGGYTVKLSKAAIKFLDKKFSTKAFKKHPTLGTGTTTLKFKK
jgi:hypothetical protein